MAKIRISFSDGLYSYHEPTGSEQDIEVSDELLVAWKAIDEAFCVVQRQLQALDNANYVRFEKDQIR